MTNTLTSPIIAQLPGVFEQHLSDRKQAEPASLLTQRDEAFKTFMLKGFPAYRTEEWKYTNVAPFLQEAFSFDTTTTVANTTVEELLKAAIPAGLDAYTLVCVNGKFQKELSQVPAEADVQITTVSAAIEAGAYAPHFNTEYDYKHTFEDLNTALFEEGMMIVVKKGASVDKPMHIIHLYHHSSPLFAQTRQLWVVEEGAQAQIIETLVDPASNNAVLFNNNVTEIVTEATANLQHYQLQTALHHVRIVHQTRVHQHEDSVYSHFAFIMSSAAFTRNNIDIVHVGEHIETNLYGFYLASEQQLIDNHTAVHHAKPNCNSNELYKGVLLDKAVGVFNGKIFVHQDAQKTNAFQQNNNMILSEGAMVYTKPQLEIYADDVKCSHGTTIGQVSEEALFYLKSRGIGEAAARNMLVHAFAYDVTAQITVPAIRKYIEQIADEYLDTFANN
ncbi:iron-regulated ABC transporter permease protein SufD [Chitinophaga skermanii]|uniref:Iron-regulated ABC transporter permease protein SufD n=1 Tax=Chitinophaga skermanii TaxID=331697 RepID=A0A327QQU1_9BACT|nr:Fe-S cluster assembly protein SufD [Chitinophaga skermanii]RAJ06700.1 iron-regulated ABC transporter permease protein SufD [Chitinophaga skermanii]